MICYRTPQSNFKASFWPLKYILFATPTVFRHDSEGDTIAGVFDELDNIVVRQLHDGEVVDSGDTVPHFHLTYAVGGAALDNTPNLVRYN